MCRWLTAPLAIAIAAPQAGCRGRIVSGRCALHRPYSWEDLKAHAANQSARYAAGEYPGRSPNGNAMYDRYKRWCIEHGRISNADYVVRYVRWHGGSALEPSLAPYLLDDGIEHWILWHHPNKTPGDTELDPASEAAVARALVAREIKGEASPSDVPLVCFQNVPPLRSIPTIAHSHVFLRVGSMLPEARRAVGAMRGAWRQRSPWLYLEGYAGAGRGRELGWALSRYFGAFLGMIVFPRIDAADVATAADASGGA